MSKYNRAYANILNSAKIQNVTIQKAQPETMPIKSKDFTGLPNTVWRGFSYDSFSDELLKVMDKCGVLYTVEDPCRYITYSNIIYRTLPLLGKAIRLRQTFIGTVSVAANRKKGAEAINNVIDFMMNEMPIIQAGNLTDDGVGLNSLLNTLVANCDVQGTCFIKPSYDSKSQVDKIVVYNSKRFAYGFDENGNKNLYYNGSKIDINSLYIFKLGTVTGYDWGTPLIYGDKLMADAIVKLLHAQVQGLLRNMNPFLLTMIGIDSATYLELSVQEREELRTQINELEENVAYASKKAMNGQSMHQISSLPAINSVNSVQLGSDIKIMDSKTLFTMLDILCAGLEVPVQLMLNSSGSMNTDQSKVAALLMESWASEYARPVILPKLRKLIFEILASYNILVTKKDITVEIVKNETLISGLVPPQNTNTPPPEPTPQNQ